MSDKLKTEAGVNLPQTLLQLIDYFGFVQYNDTYLLHINNQTNCQFMISLRLLNDFKTIRISVVDEMEPIDMFESQDYDKIEMFVNLVR